MSAGHGGFENYSAIRTQSLEVHVNQVVQIGAGWADGNGKLDGINSGVDSAKSFKFGVDVRG